jgi:hypothetical protein
MHAKAKSAGKAEEHVGKFAAKAMKVIGKSVGNVQQIKNTMKIFMIFINNFPEISKCSRNTN